jgi:hypothetical protein
MSHQEEELNISRVATPVENDGMSWPSKSKSDIKGNTSEY